MIFLYCTVLWEPKIRTEWGIPVALSSTNVIDIRYYAYSEVSYNEMSDKSYNLEYCSIET